MDSNSPRPPKVANAGTLMFRRSDIIHLFSKSKARAVKAMNLAKNEGRYEDAEIHAARMRALNSIREDLFLKTPLFVNPGSVETCNPPRLEARDA